MQFFILWGNTTTAHVVGIELLTTPMASITMTRSLTWVVIIKWFLGQQMTLLDKRTKGSAVFPREFPALPFPPLCCAQRSCPYGS